jgi:hypothetical protein
VGTRAAGLSAISVIASARLVSSGSDGICTIGLAEVVCAVRSGIGLGPLPTNAEERPPLKSIFTA